MPAVVSMIVSAFLIGTQPAEPSAQTTLPLSGLQEQLEALHPSKPEAYFLLGEEIAQEVSSPEEFALARTLLVLAFHLDQAQGGTLSPSCAIALAQLLGIGQDRDWLISLAHALDHRYAEPDWRGASPSEASDLDAYHAALAVGLVRSGHGHEAMDLLEDPATMKLIRRYEALLSPANQPGSASWLLREARRWPCPECGFDRINRAIDGSPTGYVRCRVCDGNPGPVISVQELIAQLRFEARMLDGVQRSWAAQVIADGGAPLRDPSAKDLAPTLGVDPRLTIWREGKWVAPPKDDVLPSEPVTDSPLKRESDPDARAESSSA